MAAGSRQLYSLATKMVFGSILLSFDITRSDLYNLLIGSTVILKKTFSS